MSEELRETRKALALYRQELLRLKQSIEPVDPNLQQFAEEQDSQPPQPVRRISHLKQGQTSASTGRRNAAPPKILEAGYEEEADVVEEIQEPRYPQRDQLPSSRSTQASGPRASAPAKRVALAPRELELPTPPNVGFSYIPDEEDAAQVDDGLGVWKDEVRRPAAKPANGSAKRSSR